MGSLSRETNNKREPSRNFRTENINSKAQSSMDRFNSHADITRKSKLTLI